MIRLTLGDRSATKGNQLTHELVTALSEQENNWLADAVRRLRLIQANGRDVAPAKRAEYLREELTRNLDTVPPANRKRFLQALLSQFPVAGRTVAQPRSAPPEPVPPAESQDEALERFLQMLTELAPEKRPAITQRLSAAGVVGVKQEDDQSALAEELRVALRLPAGQTPQLNRLARLAVVLIDMLQRVDERALDTMRDLSAKHPLLKRPQDLRQAAAQWLSGDNTALEAHLRMVSSLLGALLAALQAGAKDFGHQYLERFSPSAILEVVESEKRFGWLPGQPSKKECCWEKYEDLANALATADLVDRQIKDCLVAFMKRRGLGGQPPG